MYWMWIMCISKRSSKLNRWHWIHRFDFSIWTQPVEYLGKYYYWHLDLMWVSSSWCIVLQKYVYACSEVSLPIGEYGKGKFKSSLILRKRNRIVLHRREKVITIETRKPKFWLNFIRILRTTIKVHWFLCRKSKVDGIPINSSMIKQHANVDWEAVLWFVVKWGFVPAKYSH